MAGRPEILYPLFGALTVLDGIGEKMAQNFAQMGVEKPRDLLFTLPQSGIDRAKRDTIRDVVAPAVVTVEVEIGMHVPPRSKGRPYHVHVSDAQTEFRLVFFHAHGDYLKKQLPTGQRRVVSGKIEIFDGIGQMVHPDHMLPVSQADEIAPFEPVYPLTQGVTQKIIARAMRSALERVVDLPEWIDPGQRARAGWPGWADAIRTAHAPQSLSDIGPSVPVRERLAYDELFAHQLKLALARQTARAKPGRASTGDGALSNNCLLYTSDAADE